MPTSSFAAWISHPLSGNLAECRCYKLQLGTLRRLSSSPPPTIPKSECFLDHFSFWVNLDLSEQTSARKSVKRPVGLLTSFGFFPPLAMNNSAFQGDGHHLLPEEAKLFIPSQFAATEGDDIGNTWEKCFQEHQ